MIYNILCNGVNIYDATPEMGIVSPQLDLELNASGQLTFTVLPNHYYYNLIEPLTANIEVYEGEDLLFFGRIIDTTKDFLNRIKVTCEGALGFFNDSIQYPRVFDDVDPDEAEGDTPVQPNEKIYLSEFLEYLITEHNKQVTSIDRKFKMGRFTMTDKRVYRELNYEKTIDCIKTMCLDAEGGYIFTRKEDDGIYVDWLKQIPGLSSQPIQYALNLKDLSQDFKGSTLVTSIIPIGMDDLNLQTPDPEGQPPTPDPNQRNPGQIYVDSEAVDTYGRIIAKVDFNDISDKIELYQKAIKWLDDNMYDANTISVSSADLSYFNPNYSKFQLGDSVHVTSDPHLIDKDFPIIKISYKLDSPLKEVTIGTEPRETLTEIYSSGGGGGGKNSVTKSQAKRIASAAIDSINYVDKIYENLDLKIDETDHTIHSYYGNDPEGDNKLLLDETGLEIVDTLDDIADKLLNILQYPEPETGD